MKITVIRCPSLTACVRVHYMHSMSARLSPGDGIWRTRNQIHLPSDNDDSPLSLSFPLTSLICCGSAIVKMEEEREEEEEAGGRNLMRTASSAACAGTGYCLLIHEEFG